METFVALIAIGLVAGVMAGMFGIGGGVVIVPALIALLSFSQTVANGTSLAALLLPVGILGAREYYKAGLLSVRLSLLLGIGLFVGGWIGARIALGLDPLTLSRAYGVFLLYVFWRFTEPLKWWAEWRNPTPQTGEKQAEAPINTTTVPLPTILIIGFVAGILSGMFGIGGGVIMVTALMAFAGMSQKAANGTSLGSMLLPVGALSVWEYYSAGDLDPAVAGGVALGLLFGALIGARITLALPAKVIKRAYGIFLLLLSVRFLFPDLMG